MAKIQPMSPADQRAAMVQNNAVVRSLLLQTGIRQQKNLGITVGALGQTSRIKLANVGITTSLLLYVTCPVTIGTAVAVPSVLAPYNLVKRVKITDYDGTDRINLSGFQCYVLDSVRKRQAFGYNNQQAAQSGAGIFANPSVPTAVGNGTISFFLEVPIARDDDKWHGLNQDLTGAIYSQTGLGDLYLSIDWNASLVTNGNITSVYSGAGTTTVVLNGAAGPSVQVFQRYILPQPTPIPGDRQGRTFLPIPGLDLISVYELNGNLITSDNIAVGQEKLINLPNVRKVLGVYTNFVNNATLQANDISLLRFLVNANNVIQEWSLSAQQLEQRLITEGDLAAGVYFWNFADKPIETAVFGNVQLGVTPSSVTAGVVGPYFEVMFESIYTKGAALPGMNQG